MFFVNQLAVSFGFQGPPLLFVANPLAWTPTSFAEEKGFFRIRGATMASWRCSHRDQQLSNVSGPPGNLQDIPFAAMTPPPGTRAARNRNLRGGKAEVKTICRESQHNLGLGSNLDSCMCTENMIQIRGGVNPRCKEHSQGLDVTLDRGSGGPSKRAIAQRGTFILPLPKVAHISSALLCQNKDCAHVCKPRCC